MYICHMFMFANTALLGGGVRVGVWISEQRDQKEIKVSKTLMANLDITPYVN